MRKILLILIIFYAASNISFAQTYKVSMLFAGDAMQHKNQIEAAKKS